ncbi:MAG TPA: carbamate kinase [Thermoplasmatales archaeon]|nr:carbamate kinase [Thermoplasmatales archaeon]HEX17587.1 carbamate kinase [Thermoplasmatales archaeon]
MIKRAVIALGGNALIKPGQKGTIYEQFANTRETVKSIVKIIKDGWDVVLTHGNGPQVGAILLQNQAGRDLVPPMPLGICVAESQGLIGYMIQQCLSNALRKEGIKKDVVTIITQVLVDDNDPAFENPTKPIGPYFDGNQALKLLKDGYQMTKQKNGWRIVVPSPDPKAIVEAKVIKTLLDNGVIVIAAGGGGMPVIERKGWGLDGREAVVDKDLSAERLAEDIGANVLLILTDVPYVYLNYGSERQRALKEVKLEEIKKYYEDGHFPAGSMGPKVLAAIRFLESGGERAIIADIDHAWEALKGKTGTHITR